MPKLTMMVQMVPFIKPQRSAYAAFCWRKCSLSLSPCCTTRIPFCEQSARLLDCLFGGEGKKKVGSGVTWWGVGVV